jgi:hypothetical protein
MLSMRAQTMSAAAVRNFCPRFTVFDLLQNAGAGEYQSLFADFKTQRTLTLRFFRTAMRCCCGATCCFWLRKG